MLKKKTLLLLIIAALAVFIIILIVTPGEELSFALNVDEIKDKAEKLPLFKKDLKKEHPKPLENPPTLIKAIYSTAWSAGNENKIDYFIDLINSTELNAIVIDIKDYSGVLSYRPELEKVLEYDAYENRIPDIDALVNRLHEHNIYLIARISVFQDNKLATARPDLAIKSKASGEIWGDRKDVHWMDSSSQEVWDYNIAIAKDILGHGFDEINLDYIRFATDGSLDDIGYPFYDEVEPKHAVLARFFEYVRKQLPKAKISADLFGLVTVNHDDLGIGQKIEDAFPYINASAPMTYPSHYASGFIGIAKPAEHPYEVMKYSIDKALARLDALYQPKIIEIPADPSDPESTPSFKEEDPEVSSYAVKPQIRPWIQDFDLGADYTAAMVRAQIQAIEDSASSYSGCASLSANKDCSKYISGWMLWNPSNVYTKEALLVE